MGAFKDSGIISVSDLGNCNKFPDGYAAQDTGCFAGCTNLTFVNLPQDFYYIGDLSFLHCSHLSVINGIDHVTTIGGYAFCGCTGLLNSVLYCRDLITIRSDAFRGASIKGLYLPNFNTTTSEGYYDSYNYHSGTFAQATIKLLYFKDISTFHIDFPRSNIDALVINNTTIPSINPKSDDSSNTNWNAQPERIFEAATIGAIYVPDSAVQSYQNHSIWGTKTIKPISELNRVATKALWDQLTDVQKNTTLIEEYM